MRKEITIVDNALYAEFKKECKVITLVKEYPEHIGYEKYMILTDIPREELTRKYDKLLKNYEPYIVDSMRLYSPISDYAKNEDKFEKRNARNTISIEVNNDDEQTFSSLQVQDFLTTYLAGCHDKEVQKAVWKALKKLTNNQRRRLIMWAMEGKAMMEIAEIEGVSKQMIWQSIQSAKKRFEKYFDKTFTFSAHLSKEDEGIINDGKYEPRIKKN